MFNQNERYIKSECSRMKNQYSANVDSVISSLGRSKFSLQTSVY